MRSKALSGVLVALIALFALGSFSGRSAAQSSIDQGYFDATLSTYGRWVVDPRWGRVWQPLHLRAGWRPYLQGTWVYTRDYGWMWVSDEPYGWVVYHYGRWVYSATYGWVWLAGYEWAPAWVEWCHGGGYVGWAPAQPDFYWQGDYYYGSYDCTSPVFYSHAVFVTEGYYGRRDMASHAEPRSRNALAAKATVNVTAYGRGSSGIVNGGLDVAKLEAATGRHFEPVAVISADAPVKAGLGTAHQLEVFRPAVVGAATPELNVQLPANLHTDIPTASSLNLPAADAFGSTSVTAPLPSLDVRSAPPAVSLPSAGQALPSVGLGVGGRGAGGLLGR